MTEGFWEDLKRRRVFRVAAGYVAVAFAGLEGAELVLPRLGLPDRVLTVLVLLAVLGFPLTLVLSWLFELTPGGLVRTAPRHDAAGTAAGPEGGPRHGPLRVAGLVLATALFAGAAWFWIPRSPAFRGPDVDPDALVVLPFDVRGSDDVAYLREGMVDLLSTKLDGVGGLRVVDPQTTLARLKDRDAESVSGEAGREVSARLGAGRTLEGSVVWVSGALQVRAVVFGPGEDERVAASVEGVPDELFGLVDRLVSELVSRGLLAEQAPLSSLEGLTTSSTDALRLYLAGIQGFRSSGGNRPDFELLRQAVELDSTFALAAYWAGYAAEYAEITDPLPYYDLASRHQDRLRTRDRLRLAAARAGASGLHREAIQLYSGLTERYPDDVASWFQLGEQLAHTGEYSGRTLDEALPVYERALDLDPGLAPAYYHLAHILSLQGDSAGLAAWEKRGAAAGVDSLWTAILAMMHGLLVADSAEVERSFHVYQAAETIVPPATLASSLAYLTGATLEYAPAASRALGYEFADEALTDTARVVALRRQARIEAEAGRFEAAERALPEDPLMGPALRAQDVAWIALHPASGSAERVRAVYDALVATGPPAGSGTAAARLYLLGRLALVTGSTGDLAAARGSLQAFRATTPEVERFAGDLRLELDAAAAAARGDPAGALDTLLRASYWERTPVWLAFPEGSPLTTPLADRTPAFLRAELLRELGRDEEAATWYRVAADGLWYRAPALRELARIREAEGHSEEATALRSRVAALWSEADPGVRRE
ncbi:MAG: tetratricopeptide repeat protein [Gemmatimonadales bacterium]|jgi:tetratricopeptide (TPR) repeat protein/TolB-like protein